jgi:lipoprotein LprG
MESSAGVAGHKTVAVRTVCALIGLSLMVASCGGHQSPTEAVTPLALLQKSRTVVDATPAIHFNLSSTNVSHSGTELTGGSGDLVRPDGLTGSFSISSSGLGATVAVVEAGGRFYAKLPFTTHYVVTTPESFGLRDPAQLLNPNTGLSPLLTSMAGVHTEGSRRISGELVTVISGTIPGREVPVLPDLARSLPVSLTASIDPRSDQLRQVTLAGPFTSATATTTYTVTLTDYGEHVKITAPDA